jgi:hypothetical protein
MGLDLTSVRDRTSSRWGRVRASRQIASSYVRVPPLVPLGGPSSRSPESNQPVLFEVGFNQVEEGQVTIDQ